MKKLWLIPIASLMFVGCSTKINPQEFHKVQAKEAQIKPSVKEMFSKTKVLVVPFKGNYSNLNEIATEKLKSMLSEYNAVKLINRKFKSIDEEVKLAEQAKDADVDLDNANYIIKGKISSISTSSVYMPPKTITVHGKTITIPAKYKNEACVVGSLEFIKIPQNYVEKTIELKDCETKDTERKLYSLSEFADLLNTAAQEAIEDKKEIIYNTLAKKGYIYEIRKKDDKTIIHTTLGKEFGAKPGLKVNIYTIKKVKVPFTKDKYEYKEVKIGEGEISNIVNDKDSWVIVTKTKEPIKIGDYVKPVFEKSTFDMLLKGVKTIKSVI